MLNVARRKIKEFHLICDTAVLVHIGKENMKELHVDGLLESVLFLNELMLVRSLQKMTKTPFTGQSRMDD